MSSTNIPDTFVIPPLEVNIDFGAGLGGGGFGTVYQGHLRGHLVAVKVLEKGLPPKSWCLL
ncbi:hypothetical protein JAAARDRAFT_421365 [Jaapia argillacea MUCL 33604]|uniref:Protein kinase domain-containing protein n=1 Tax=Jaapia argillacea MUCL 33604 TaxID=933084 RepID=A0A067PFM4_9AGAM|nr:hypothetical protein JAAARDRAFT_421365 [Jaapia argillacea MUCL 33604]